MGQHLLALIVLAAFLPFAIVVFKRFPRAMATSVVVMCGSILLPEHVAFDFPAIPPLDKEYVTYLSLLVAAWINCPRAIRRARPGTGLEWLVVPMSFAIVGTALANPQPLLDEGRWEPALGLYWVIANTGDDLLTLGVPFLLGRALIRSAEDLRVLLGVLAVAGAAYTVPILIEAVLSIPFRVFQLSQVIYGIPIRPQWRWGFIQPVVFMDNGLSLATFMCGALVSATGFVKAGLRIFGRAGRQLRVVVLCGLVMTLNIAGNVYGLTLLAVFALLRPRAIATVALCLACLAVTYPLLRIADAFPNRQIVALAEGFDAQRAHSLEGRFLEEEHVLGQIGHRIWFGWGNISRTPGAETFGVGETGLDGWWTIRLGSRGLVGVALQYAMLGIPIFLAWRRLRFVKSYRDRVLIAALMAIVSVRMIDLLINGWWNDLPVFLAGVLYGVSKPPREGQQTVAGTRSSALRVGTVRRQGGWT